jgi:hypothetical protein
MQSTVRLYYEFTKSEMLGACLDGFRMDKIAVNALRPVYVKMYQKVLMGACLVVRRYINDYIMYL